MKHQTPPAYALLYPVDVRIRLMDAAAAGDIDTIDRITDYLARAGYARARGDASAPWMVWR